MLFSHVLPLGLVGVVSARRFASHTIPVETVSPASGSMLFASLSHVALVCTATLLHLALVYNLATIKHGHVLEANAEISDEANAETSDEAYAEANAEAYAEIPNEGHDFVDSAVEIVPDLGYPDDDDGYDFCLHDD